MRHGPLEQSSSADERDEFSLEAARRRSIQKSIVALVAAVLVIAAVRPGYRAVKAVRSRGLAERTERALREGDLTNAVRYAQLAYLMRPNEPAALRATAKVETALGRTNALPLWEALLRSGGATAADRQEFVTAAVQGGALEKARAALVELIRAMPGDPRNLWLLARVSCAEGRLEEGREFVRQALERDGGNREYRIFAAQLDHDSTDPIRQRAAWKALMELATEPDGLDAATFLARQKGLSASEAARLIEALEKNPARKTVHQLVALDLRLQQSPEKRLDLMREARKVFGGAETVGLFAAWLNDHQEYETTLEVLPLSTALKKSEWMLLNLDALGALGRWVEIRSILANEQLALPGAFVEALRARTASKLGDGEAAAAAWKRAGQAARGNAEELAYLAQYAEKSGAYEEAGRFYRTLASTQADARATYLKWLQSAEAHGTTAEVRELLKVMAERWPEEITFRNDLAYVDLLLDRNIESATRAAAELVEGRPDNLPFRTTLALGYLRAEKPAAALAAFGNRTWDWAKALPRSRAVYAATLAANGRMKEAKTITEDIPNKALRSEEEKLLELVRR